MPEKPALHAPPEQDRPLATNGQNKMSFFYFGFGLYWAWLWILGNSSLPTLLPASRTNTDLFILFVVSSAVSAIVMLCGALSVQKLSSKTGQRILIIGACFFGLVGTVMLALYPTGGALDWSIFFTSVSMGVSRACFNLLWCKPYSSVGIKHASLYISGSITIGALLYLIVTNMQPIAALIITLLLPIAAVATYVFAAKESQPQPEREQSPGLDSAQKATAKIPSFDKTSSFPFSLFWRLFFGIGIYAIAFAFVSNTQFVQNIAGTSSVFLLTLLGVFIVGLLITLIIILVPRHLNLVSVYRLALPLMTIGFLLIPLLGIERGSLAVIFVMVGFTVFDVLTWLILANASARFKLSPYAVFGYGRGVHFSGLFIGSLVALLTLSPTENYQALFTPIALLMVFLLIVASTLVLTERELFGKGFFSFADLGSKRAATDEQNGELKRARWRERCEAVAREYDLSPREEEVLTLLAKGRDTVFIQSELNISNHTARSHVYHIYQKLDVHSRQELLDLIEESEGDEKA